MTDTFYQGLRECKSRLAEVKRLNEELQCLLNGVVQNKKAARGAVAKDQRRMLG